MKLLRFYKGLCWSALPSIVSVTVLTLSGSVQAAVSQVPNNLVEGVSPNMLLTLDDSGSMRFAFAPDNISGTQDTKRAKSSHFNPIYYNPDVTYEIPPFYDTAGKFVQLTTSFDKAYHNGFDPSVGSINLNSGYRVAWDVPVNKKPSDYSYTNSTNYSGTGVIYRLGKNPSGSGTSSGSVAAYYYKFNASNSGCNGSATNESCYTYVDVSKASSDQKQNFAIWYSFYRNRALATVSAAAVAFDGLSSNIRFSWQALNACKDFDLNNATCKYNKFTSYSLSHKGNFYSWLKTMPFDSGTPLRRSMQNAGKFLQTERAWNKYLDGNGTNSAANRYACRPSYHILMTDGMWNGDNATGTMSSDNSSKRLPDGKQYSPIAPYKDSTSNTLANVAFHYWATDLGKGIAGLDGNHRVPTFMPYKSGNDNTDYWDPRNNPATWQHMSNFIVGLALTNSLDKAGLEWEGSTFAGGYQNLLNGTKSWPAAADGSNNNVYDLWHAAINSRGEFYSVESPEAMVKAFKDILNRIAERQSTAALPVLGYSVLETETEPDEDGNTETLYQVVTHGYATSFDSTDWSGNLVKFKQITELDGKSRTTEVWNAESKLPAERNIWTAGTSGLVEFKYNNLKNNQKVLLSRNPETNNTDNRGEQRLNYIRGVRTNEGTATNSFRQRSSVLGDFLDSKAAVVNGALYLVDAANNVEENNKYTSFYQGKKGRRGQLYVGGNAGMLHAFDTATGEEKFAFVPAAAFENLYKLTDPKYGHHYFVNGSPVVADVYYDNEWHTVLIGTLGAGGKGIFALDITNPDDIKLLWEKGEDDFGDVKLGYTFSQPTVARLHNGKWAAVFGNGYESATKDGKAALYIVDIQNGSLIKSLVVQGEAGIANGLSTPRLVDFDADNVADYAYAGDLQGNMWRFDLLGDNHGSGDDIPLFGKKNGSSDNFKVSYGGKAIFKAVGKGGQPQAITTIPTIVKHPNHSGYIVVFGTGKYFEEEDKGGTDSYAQSMYGIWDKNVKGTSTSNIGWNTVARSALVEQNILEQLLGVNDNLGTNVLARTVSSKPAGWDSSKGWVLDLAVKDSGVFEGEMVVDQNPMLRFGGLLVAQSLVPSDDPCAHGAGYWTYFINPATGGRFERHVIDTYIAGSDITTPFVSAVKGGSPGGVIVRYDEKGNPTIADEEPKAEPLGRQTWRLVPDP